MTYGMSRRRRTRGSARAQSCDPVVALWREWRSASDEVGRLVREEADLDPDRCGELEAACRRLGEIERRLAGAQAASLAGAAVKLRVAVANLDAEGDGGDPQARLLASALADLDRLLEGA